MFKKVAILYFFWSFFCVSLCAQDLEITSEEPQEVTSEKTLAGRVWKFLWGVPTESSVTAMPLGLHTHFERFNGREIPNGLHPALYFAGNYKNVELAVFKNSFGDPSVALNYKRTWVFPKWERFTMQVGGGLIYGYFGRLQHSEGVPFRNTFLIKGDVMPVVGGELDYRIYKKLSLHVGIAPAIIIYGLRYRL